MADFEESLHRANEYLEQFKKSRGAAGRGHLLERALAACADAIEALEREGRATAGLVKAKEEIRRTGQSSLRAEEILRRLQQARLISPPEDQAGKGEA